MYIQTEIRRYAREMITDTPAAFAAHWFSRASDWRKLAMKSRMPETRQSAIKFALYCMEIGREYRAQIH